MRKDNWWTTINGVIIEYYADIVLLVLSLLYGAQIFKFKEILLPYAVYDWASQSNITHEIVGGIFIISGIIKLLGLLLDNYILEKISLTILSFFWTLYLISFYISPPPNTVWITAIVGVLTCYYLSLKDR